MDEQQSAAARARDEAIVQTIGAVVLIIAYVALEVAQRKASDPDVWRTWKMRAAKGVERFAAASAGNWWQVAERARLRYERERA